MPAFSSLIVSHFVFIRRAGSLPAWDIAFYGPSETTQDSGFIPAEIIVALPNRR